MLTVTTSDGLQGYGTGTLDTSSSLLQPTYSPVTTYNPQPAYDGSSQYLQPTTDPTYASFPSSTSTGGSTGGSSSTTTTAVDPYAGTVFGSTANYLRAINDYNNLKNSTFSSIGDAVTAGGQGYDYSIQHYLNGRTQQQNQIDSDAVQNELGREQGNQSILDMVGNGIRSSGVTLANRNAGSSSAADAIARAYGVEGRQQASKVGNQFAQGQNKVATEQKNLALGDSDELLTSNYDKTNTINSIINSARSQLASLNQMATYSSLPDRVDIESKIAEVKQQALDALSAYDSVLTNGISSNNPMAPDAVRAKANSLLTAGTAPEQPFNFNTSIPAQFQDTGQFASSLPIFIPKKTATE